MRPVVATLSLALAAAPLAACNPTNAPSVVTAVETIAQVAAEIDGGQALKTPAELKLACAVMNDVALVGQSVASVAPANYAAYVAPALSVVRAVAGSAVCQTPGQVDVASASATLISAIEAVRGAITQATGATVSARSSVKAARHSRPAERLRAAILRR